MDSLFLFLQKINPLTPEAISALSSICTEMDVKKNDDLHPIGHTCRNIYFVKKGLLRIYYSKEGVDITESFEQENSLVARADSLFTTKPSRKGIQAIEDTHLIAINSAHLFELYDSHPSIERLFRLVFEQAYVLSVERLESIQFYTAEERYNNLLQYSTSIVQRVPLKHIASYLGITQVSLSRIRAKG